MTVTPGEEDRQAGGGVGAADGDRDRLAGREVLTVPGEDEQRVVDADTEAEHHGDDAGDLGDGREAGQDADRAAADARWRSGPPRSAGSSRPGSRRRWPG